MSRFLVMALFYASFIQTFDGIVVGGLPCNASTNVLQFFHATFV